MNRTSRLAAVLVAVTIVALILLPACSRGAKSTTKYQCPMHPEIVRDGPGDCPICGMTLVPMAPTEPGSGARGATDAAEHANSVGSEADPDHRHAVGLTPEGIRLAGLATAPASRGTLGRAVRTVGLVVPDETRVRHVHTKFAGWVEKLFVDATGEKVRAGEPILSIYSPDVLASQEELARARTTAARLHESSLPEVREGADEILAAARRRLELLDVPADVVAEVERTGKARRDVTLLAPVSGFVTAKAVYEGQQVDPSMELYTVTDLSHVWIEASIYENEARDVKVGLEARIASPYDSSLSLAGRIAYVYPYLDPESRTLKVRFEFANPDLRLRPGMYVDVSLDLAAESGILVPDDAVVNTGLRSVVFVDRGEGRFEPREVRVGTRSEGKALLLSGLAEGDRVVVRANFLLDSESRLRAALAKIDLDEAARGHAGHAP